MKKSNAARNKQVRGRSLQHHAMTAAPKIDRGFMKIEALVQRALDKGNE